MKNLKLHQIENIKIDSGVPLPVVLSNDNNVYLLYYKPINLESPDGLPIKIDGKSYDELMMDVVTFKRCMLYKFGFPDDEALHSHPFYKFGLEPYSAHYLEKSPWIDEFIKMESKHPSFKPDKFNGLKHYIFTFHDSTFECIAMDFSLQEKNGKRTDLILNLASNL